MMRRRSLARFLPLFVLLALLAMVLSGCDVDTPQNTLNPEGDVAKKQRDMFYLAMWPALGIMILVEGAIVAFLIRFRRRKGDGVPKQTHGNTPLEIGWTILPAIFIVAVVGIPMLPVLFDIGRAPKDTAYPIIVEGQQFTWVFNYPEIIKKADGKALSTFDEIHIPTKKEIGLTITSIDVIHSFGIPRIAGTRDAVPGQEELMWIKVDKPGTYHGQCRELCGIDHAGMLITLIAHDQEDFDKWAKEAAAGVKRSTDSGDAAVSGGEGGE